MTAASYALFKLSGIPSGGEKSSNRKIS